MKSNYLIIINLLISFIGNAQITKGNWLMGGSGEF